MDKKTSKSGELQLLGVADFAGDGDDRRFDVYPCEFRPGFGLRCRSLYEDEQTEYELAAVSSKGGLKKSRLVTAKRRLIKLVAVDADGRTFLTDNHLSAMAKKDSRLIGWAFKVCAAHVGLDENDLELAVGNSAEIEDDVSQ